VSDAHEAGLRFLRHGPVRIKPVRETGGRGQIAVKSEVALQVALGSITRWRSYASGSAP